MAPSAHRRLLLSGSACALLVLAVGCSGQPTDAGSQPPTSAATTSTAPTGLAPTTSSEQMTSTSARTPAPAATSPLRVVSPRATASNNGRARVYTRLINPGFADVRLTAVQTDAGGTASLRTSAAEGTATSPPEGLVIKAGQSLTLAPGGPFIAVTDLSTPWQPGERIVVTLYTDAGTVTRFSAIVQDGSA